MNTVILTGRWTANPTVTATDGGLDVLECGLAVNDRSHTDFFDIVAFDKTAVAAAAHTCKGSRVAITGRLRQRRWSTDDGNRSRVVIEARQIEFLDRRDVTESHDEEQPDD